MLQAKLKSGKLVHPALFSRKQLQRLKEAKQIFYCPVCEEKVILRAGERVVAHFAHQKATNCLAAGGGESAYHEQGKLLLYEWLRWQKLDVQLEVYLREIKQRPDIYIRYKEKVIVMEYQCSKITETEIRKRTHTYHQAGIHVIWILGERLQKRKASHIFTVDSFTKTLIHQFATSYPLSLFYFCPLKKKFIIFQDFMFHRRNQAVGKLTVKALWQTNLIDVLAKRRMTKSDIRTIWLKEKEKFRLKRGGMRYGIEREWQTWLYEKGVHTQQLPSVIHLPVPSGYRMKVPGWIWQSKIIFQVIIPKRIGSTITVTQCIRVVKHDIVSPTYFPLIQTPACPVYEYLQLLCSVRILKQRSETAFEKLVTPPIHQQIETTQYADQQIIHTLFQK